jgi:hypothetical protein
MIIDVQAPAVTIPTDDLFYSKEFPDRPDIAFLKNHFYREGRISEEQAIFILQKGTELLRQEPNLLEVDAPITGMEHLNRRAGRQAGMQAGTVLKTTPIITHTSVHI